MRKLWAVVRREFIERVRSRWFWISAVLVPLVFAALIFLPAVFASSGGPKRLVVVDASSDGLGRRVAGALAAGGAFRVQCVPDAPGRVDSLAGAIGAKTLDGVLLISDAAVASGAVEYRAANVSSLRDVAELERVVDNVVTVARLERAGIDPAIMARAQAGIHLVTRKISGSATTAETSAQSFSLAYFMGVLLYTVILMYGVNVKSSVLEEKTTRVVEVLVSSIRPFPLLFGKVMGVGAVSLLQLGIWGVVGRLLLAERARLGKAGLDAMGGLFEMPNVSGATAAVFLAYFLGGFFLYAAMFAAVGAMSSSEQEAQQAQQPIVLVLVVSFVSMFALLNDPGSALAVTLSLVPFTSPIAMPVRWAAGDLPPVEVALSLGLLALGIVFVTWVASRIYRVGILMTGKRPSVRELARWVREG